MIRVRRSCGHVQPTEEGTDLPALRATVCDDCYRPIEFEVRGLRGTIDPRTGAIRFRDRRVADRIRAAWINGPCPITVQLLDALRAVGGRVIAWGGYDGPDRTTQPY